MNWSMATWVIHVCPTCGAQSPKHGGPCLSDDPPGLRPLHVPYRVVSETWRYKANAPGGSS